MKRENFRTKTSALTENHSLTGTFLFLLTVKNSYKSIFSDAEQTGVFESKYSFVEQIVIYGFGSSAPKSVKITANGKRHNLTIREFSCLRFKLGARKPGQRNDALHSKTEHKINRFFHTHHRVTTQHMSLKIIFLFLSTYLEQLSYPLSHTTSKKVQLQTT